MLIPLNFGIFEEPLSTLEFIKPWYSRAYLVDIFKETNVERLDDLAISNPFLEWYKSIHS
jgi:hypothetical protein